MRFIHLSNVRLEQEDIRAFRDIDFNEERWEDLKKVMTTCNEYNVDALFITGNLFGKVPEEKDVKRLDELFALLKATRVYLLTGTMDAPDVPTDAQNYTFASDVTVFSGDTIQRVYVAGWNAEITAVGYSPRTWTKIDPQSLKRGKKGVIQILLLPFLLDETSIEGLDNMNFEFDYAGIGQQVLYKGNGSNKLFSPGIFTPTGLSSQSGHGFFMVTMNVGRKQEVSQIRQFVNAVKREYMSLTVGLTPDLSFEDVTGQLKETFNRLGENNIYDITLEGGMSPTVFYHKDELEQAGLIEHITDATDMKKTVEAVKNYKDNEALSRFARSLFSSDEEPDEIRIRALRFGMQELL